MSLAAPAKSRTGRVADAPSPRSAKRRNAIVGPPHSHRRRLRHAHAVHLDGDGGHEGTAEAFSNPPVFFYQPSLQAFVDLWPTTNFAQYLLNTVVVAIASVIVALVVGAPAAYALSRYGGQIGALLLVLALIFRALPRFAVALPIYNFAQALGIYDTKIALTDRLWLL